MGPFKAEGQKLNRVEKFMVIAFFSAFAGMIAFTFLYLGITDFHQGGWAYLVLFSVMGTAVGDDIREIIEFSQEEFEKLYSKEMGYYHFVE